MRLDAWLRKKFPTLNRRHVEEAIERGFVRLNGKTLLKKGVALDDTSFSLVDVSLLNEYLDSLRKPAFPIQIPIIFESDEFWIVDKPAGVPSQPISLFDRSTLTEWAMMKCPTLQSEFIGIQPCVTPHRLDIGTSGIQVVAKTSESFGLWRERFETGCVRKEYLAWCWGIPEQKNWTVREPLAHSASRSSIIVTAKGGERWRPPIMEAESYCCLEEVRGPIGVSLIRIKTETGATHQVRVHLAASGFPLVGDSQYDPDFKLRKVKPPHHLLRAIFLDCEDEGWRVDDLGFRREF